MKYEYIIYFGNSKTANWSYFEELEKSSFIVEDDFLEHANARALKKVKKTSILIRHFIEADDETVQKDCPKLTDFLFRKTENKRGQLTAFIKLSTGDVYYLPDSMMI